MKAVVARLTLVCVCLIIVSLMSTRGSYAEIKPEDIAGIWLLNEDKGNKAEDTSGNGNDGTMSGNPEWVDGKFGKALEFDGVDDLVDVVSSNIGTGDKLTISVLVKPDDQPLVPWQHRDIIRSGGHGGGMWAICTHDTFNQDGKIRFLVAWIEGGEGLGWKMVESLVKNEWNHLALVMDRDAGKALFYLNGECVADHDTPVGAKPVTRGFGIGFDWAGAFKGIVDEVAIFNAALSKDDIEHIATKGVEEGLFPTAVDLSGKLTTTWAQVRSG